MTYIQHETQKEIFNCGNVSVIKQTTIAYIYVVPINSKLNLCNCEHASSELIMSDNNF